MTDTGLEAARVVVIGGTSGIGFAVAQRAHALGADVIVGSSNADKVSDALARLGGGAEGHVIDVRDEDSVAGFFTGIGAFDHLAYTAGDWGPQRDGGGIAEMDLTRANGTFAVRFWGALAAIKHATPHLSRNGSVTLTDGMIAHRPRKNAALGSAMAGAIEHLTRGLAVELAPVRVNAVCPGYVLTEVWNRMPQAERSERLRLMTERQPLPRAGDPGELAEAYLYLMRGGFTTGQVLLVDGGMSLI
jgi:NAD(P)-dependent dehydrogenase (short-subunit alcohol dehydrogenase family)